MRQASGICSAASTSSATIPTGANSRATLRLLPAIALERRYSSNSTGVPSRARRPR